MSAMAQGQSPLVGYNTNVRHKGKLYHIQTEDSGVNRPHIITHLFADGGRIVASKKTSYSELVGAEDLATLVKQMMKDQHKAMFIGLRDGEFDEEGDDQDVAPEKPAATPQAAAPAKVDFAALDAAAAKIAEAAKESSPPASLYAPTRKPAGLGQKPAPPSNRPAPSSIFGGDLVSEKSLDEVILSYLADDLDDA